MFPGSQGWFQAEIASVATLANLAKYVTLGGLTDSKGIAEANGGESGIRTVSPPN